MELRFVVERIHEDPKGLPEEIAPEVMEAGSYLRLFGERVGIELDPVGARDLMKGLDPFGSWTRLPDGHDLSLFLDSSQWNRMESAAEPRFSGCTSRHV